MNTPRTALASRTLHQPLAFATFIVASLAALSRLYLWIGEFGVDFPFFDEWVFLRDFITHYIRGGIGAYDLLAPHNEHRISTTRATYIILYHLSALDRISAYYVNWSFAVLIMAAWFSFQRRLFGGATAIPVTVSILTAFLTASPHQLENWTWGFQVQWFQHVLGMLVVVQLLCSDKLRLYLAVPCAIVTSLTISAGLLIWPLGCFILLVRAIACTASWRPLVMWVVMSAISWLLYNRNLPGASPALTLLFQDPLGVGHTYLTLLGTSVARFELHFAAFYGFGVLVVAGACIVTVALRFVWRGFAYEPGQLAGITLILYGLAAAFLITLARHPLGGAQYVYDASRYTTLTTVLWIATFSTLTSLLSSIRQSGVVLGTAFGLIAMAYIQSTSPAEREWNHRRYILSSSRAAVLSTDSTLFEKNPDIATAVARIGLFSFDTLRFLREEHLAPFEYLVDRKAPLASTVCAGPVRGHVDEVQVVQVDGAPALSIRGWAFDSSHRDPRETRVYIVANGIAEATSPTDERPDIPIAFAGAPLVSGWKYLMKGDNTSAVTVGLAQDGGETCLLPPAVAAETQ